VTKNFKPYGENDPRIQTVLYMMEASTKKTISVLDNTFERQAVVAMLATSLGMVLGELQAIHAHHAKECDNCSNSFFDHYELVVKNFGAAFGQAKAHAEQHYADLAAKADGELERVLKEHSHGKE
jgi:hypothetical protein